MDQKETIKAYAKSLGFDVVGFMRPADMPSVVSGLKAFLDNNHHGDMDWLERRVDERASPSALWPEVKTVIVLGHNYGPGSNPLDALANKEQAVFSCYAKGDDYHDVIKKKLKVFARWMVESQGGDVKVFVDTAPVMEKPLAQAAGIGWQGKHTCVVSREFGGWLFLGELFTTLEIEPDTAEKDHCGSCSACMDICPTQAFTKERALDARKCISYLTIEHKGHIPREFRKAIGNRIYGCDDCLAVCPWNKFAQESSEMAYHPRAALKTPLIAEMLTLDDAAFRTMFAKSPVKRIGRDRLIRNLLIAAGNSGNSALIPTVKLHLNDPSTLVRLAAVWALRELSALEFSNARTIYIETEKDADVALEWNTAN